MSGDLYKSWALESSSEDPIQLREFEVSIFRANRFLSIRLESEAVSRLTSLATSYLAIITGANWFITQHWGFFLHQVFYRGIYVGFLAGTEVLLLPGLYTTVLKGFENWSSQGLEFYPTLSAVWWRETFRFTDFGLLQVPPSPQGESQWHLPVTRSAHSVFYCNTRWSESKAMPAVNWLQWEHLQCGMWTRL